jgi:hypothetical protein
VHVPPAVQKSMVHALPSLHWASVLHPPPHPGIATCAHPFAASHESVVHGSPSSHVVQAPTHDPAWHASPRVHAFPSLHAVPSLAVTIVQRGGFWSSAHFAVEQTS